MWLNRLNTYSGVLWYTDKRNSGDKDLKRTQQIFKAFFQQYSENTSNALFSFSTLSEWVIALRRPLHHQHENSPLPHLSDIESFVVDVEILTHFDDWLRRFEISLLCAAPKISEKRKTMVLATKLSTYAFAEFAKCCLPKDVTDYSYEETVARLRLLFSKQCSVFADRYNCMRLTRDKGEEFKHLVNQCKAALKSSSSKS